MIVSTMLVNPEKENAMHMDEDSEDDGSQRRMLRGRGVERNSDAEELMQRTVKSSFLLQLVVGVWSLEH
jgi:hypothetical protein